MHHFHVVETPLAGTSVRLPVLEYVDGELQHPDSPVGIFHMTTYWKYPLYKVSNRTSNILFFKLLNFKLLNFLYRHTVVSSETLGTCERLAQGRYSETQRGFEPATC